MIPPFRCFWLVLAAIGGHEVMMNPASAEPESAPIARKKTLLMVDDAEVLYRSGTQRVFQPASRFSTEPLIAEQYPWERAIAWTAVHRDPESGKYQLWYQAYAGKGDHPKTHDCLVCYAESEDGTHFTKPKLGLHAFEGIEDTNIVLVGNGGYGDRYGNAVVVDPREPDPMKRYKMAYYDWSTQEGREYPGLHL
ncbi:MAG: hypothetical protein KDM63_11700, partial [Verrucomicrobiae bacterium]|nr:hypothetical protein [Verrucomicrobiae bacterium]